MTRHRWLISCLLATAFLIGIGVAQAIDTSTLGTGATPPAPGNPTRTPPVLVISFPDQILMHNMGIAAGGSHYYTCNGGNAGSGQINTYDLNGTFQHSTPCYLDMRAIFYNAVDGQLYAKTYDQALYRVDPTTGATTLVFSGIFAYSQSSPALTPDGQTILEHENGTIRFISFQTGQLIGTLTGFYFGNYPSNEAVGTDGGRIFTWDGTLVNVYDMTGVPIESYNIPSGHFGFTLKFVNGLLFAADDGGGGTGTWYGYDVGGGVPIQETSWGGIKHLFR